MTIAGAEITNSNDDGDRACPVRPVVHRDAGAVTATSQARLPTVSMTARAVASEYAVTTVSGAPVSTSRPVPIPTRISNAP